MPYYFMRDTPLQAMEQLMMSQPGQKPRGGGIYRSPFHYTPKDVACKYCQNYDRKHSCRLYECTCLEERIEAGVLELNEFVMNALKFYVGFLNTKNASAFLPEVLSTTLTGTLDGFAGRISSLLFKQGVDINLMAQIIAYDTDIDEGAYERLRGRAIRDMKRTNGRISFKDAMEFQKSV